MNRTMTVTLTIEVRDPTEQELFDGGAGPEEGEEDDWDASESEIADLRAAEIAQLIPYTLKADDTQDEMFAGSAIFARIVDVNLVSAEWVG